MKERYLEDERTLITQLNNQLKDAGINIEKWGKGEAKTLMHLVKEVHSGESTLTYKSNGKLIRLVTVCGANVFYTGANSKKYHLKENRQVFSDGRERKRILGQSVSEKVGSNEDPSDAMIRGIREELNINGDIKVNFEGTTQETINSPSYPGLESNYVLHKFHVYLNIDQFNPKGYVEIQQDKKTYFIWEECL